jgi:hypothetical protein
MFQISGTGMAPGNATGAVRGKIPSTAPDTWIFSGINV